MVGHAHDLPRWVNLALPAELKARVEAPGWASDRGHQLGCDDASLYRRFHQVGLTQVKKFPQFAAFDEQSRLVFAGRDPADAPSRRSTGVAPRRGAGRDRRDLLYRHAISLRRGDEAHRCCLG